MQSRISFLNRMPLIMILMASMLGVLVSTYSYAHQQKEAYITLLFNKNTGNLEVHHRFLLHDAEHIFAKLFDSNKLKLSGDLSTDKASQAAFSEYVEDHFKLTASGSESLTLSSVGHEVQGKYLWVYQETPTPETDELYIKHSALQALWPDQINHINVERDGEVRSLRLQRSDSNRWRKIELRDRSSGG